MKKLILFVTLAAITAQARAEEPLTQHQNLKAIMDGTGPVLTSAFPVKNTAEERPGIKIPADSPSIEQEKPAKSKEREAEKSQRRRSRRNLWMTIGSVLALAGTLGAFATIPFIVFAGSGGALPAIAIIALTTAVIGWGLLWLADNIL